MNKNPFETRQRAEDLIREALGIWRQSDQSDYLEGLENDPVFRLLMMATAYQANEIDAEIERLKGDVIDEYSKAVLPYMAGHAVPASLVVSTGIADGVDCVRLNSDTPFILADHNYSFLPLLRTTAFNAQVKSVVRTDGRRWKVTVEFASNVENLEGMAFIVKDASFSNLKLFCGGRQLPISKPWEPYNLPYSDAFSMDTMLYNRSQIYDGSVAVTDLFDTSGLRMFIVGEHDPEQYGYVEKSELEFEFEFYDISSDYPFNKEQLILNPVILVNATMNSAQLSSTLPFVRIGGESCQFMHLVRPSSDLVYHNCILQVRKVAADRFNRSSLVRLLTSLSAKFSSDFYAFQDIYSANGDKVIQTVNALLKKMTDAASEDGEGRSSGTYLVLRQGPVGHKNDISVKVNYLTTDGAAVNEALASGCGFAAPLGINQDSIALLATPEEGRDEINPVDFPEFVSYYIATNNRIVTPADMRLFCISELNIRYGIDNSMVKSLKVRREQDFSMDCGYLITVAIVLKDNMFVRRSLGDNVDSAASKMERKIASRSAGIYPVRVMIKFTDEK